MSWLDVVNSLTLDDIIDSLQFRQSNSDSESFYSGCSYNDPYYSDNSDEDYVEDSYNYGSRLAYNIVKEQKQLIFAAIEEGRTQDLRQLIRSENASLRVCFDSVCHAVSRNQMNTAKLILRWTPSSVIMPDQVRPFSEEKTSASSKEPRSLDVETRFLALAVEKQKDTVVRLLLSEGADAHAKVRHDLRSIHIAVEEDCTTIVENLLIYGADANSLYPDASLFHKKIRTVLHYAVHKQNAGIVKLLLNYGADVNAKASDGTTALHLAAVQNSIEIAELLLREGADVNVTNETEKSDIVEEYNGDLSCYGLSFRQRECRGKKDKGTPLKIAVQNCHIEMVKLFLESGAYVNGRDNRGYTMLQLAVKTGCPPVVFSILEGCPNLHDEGNKTALCLAITEIEARPDIGVEAVGSITDALQKFGFTLNAPQVIHDTRLLFNAVALNLYSITEFLLQNGASVNKKYDSQKLYYKFLPSLLHVAIERKNKAMVQLLLDHGANPNITNEDGNTPLLFSVVLSELEIAEILIKNGARVDDELIMVFAAVKFDSRFVQTLLNKGAELDQRTTTLRMSTTLPSWGKTTLTSDFESPEHFLSQRDIFHLSPEVSNLYDFLQGPPPPTKLTTTRVLPYTLNGLSQQFFCDVTPLSASARAGDLETVELLLEKGANIHSASKEGFTALHEAAFAGHEEIVQLLIQSKANVYAKSEGGTPLCLAAKNKKWNVVKILFSSGADFKETEGLSSCRSIIHKAITSEAHESVVKLLLEKGAKCHDAYELESLILALASEKKLDLIELLISCNDNITLHQRGVESILNLSVESQSRELVSFVLKHFFRSCELGNEFATPLLVSAAKGNKEIVEVFLNSGFDVNSVGRYESCRSRVLDIAVEYGRVDVVHTLLRHGAKVNFQSVFDSHVNYSIPKTPLTIAAGKGYVDIAEALIEYGADVNEVDEQRESPLYAASAKGCFETVRLLLEKGAVPDKSNSYRGTALSISASKGHMAVLRILMRYNATVNVVDPEGRTPLYRASEAGHIRIVRLLLKRSAAPDISTKNDDTPLAVAAERGYSKIVTALIKAGASVNAMDKGGKSPLYNAATNGHIKIVRLLLKHRAIVDTETVSLAVSKSPLNEGQPRTDGNLSSSTKRISPIHDAVRSNRQDIVELLLKYGANINARDSYGMTPLIICAECRNERILETLLKNGACTEEKDDAGRTALHHAVGTKKKKIVQLLLESGVNVHAKDAEGRTPLFIAVAHHKLDNIEALLGLGADINATDESGATPLAKALKNFDDEGSVVTLLLAFGAAINTQSVLKYLSTREAYKSDKNVKAVFEHAIKLKAAKLNGAEEVLKATPDENESQFSAFEGKCKAEIVEMRNDFICNTDTTFYEILSKNSKELARFGDNRDFADIFHTSMVKRKYPIYASIIYAQFKKGEFRRNLEEQSMTSFCLMICQKADLPFELIEKVLSYLCNDDLSTLIFACKPLKRKDPGTLSPALSLEELDLFDV